MTIEIRHERSEDDRIVEKITREAFWNLYCPGCNEHLIIHNLRTHPDFIPELTFVIEPDGVVVGSIFYSRSKVIEESGEEHKTISFGPVSISPLLHRRGLGRRLISHSIDAAKQLGYRAIIIGGYPYHYSTYGFEGAKKYQISLPDENYYTGIMALPLFDGALDGIHGSVHFSETMEPDESQLADFEKGFSEKEKLITASQAQFEKAVIEIDETIYAE